MAQISLRQQPAEKGYKVHPGKESTPERHRAHYIKKHEKKRAQSELKLQSEKLVNGIKEKSKRASLLRKMGELLQSCSQLPEAFSIVLGFAPRIFPEFRGALLLMNDSRNHLEVVGGWAGHEPAESIYEPSACWAL